MPATPTPTVNEPVDALGVTGGTLDGDGRRIALATYDSWSRG